MQDLDAALAQQAPPQQADNPALHELPPLVIDGIPTPLDKMTQVDAQVHTKIQSGAVIMQSINKWYCINHDTDWDRI